MDNAAVSGGGGANARQALAARLQAGSPPDSWQVHPAGQLKSYVDGGQVADLTELWTQNELGTSQMPKDVAEAQQVNGKYYTVPIGVHRGNVLWTNPAVLSKANVTIDPQPAVDGLIAGLKKVRVNAGPRRSASATRTSSPHRSCWNHSSCPGRARMTGRSCSPTRYSFDAPEVKQALEDYKTILSLANKDHSAVTWDEAAKKMADGSCAVTLMGDWAYGEMVNAGKKPGTDFAWVTFPGKADVFDYVGDGFSSRQTIFRMPMRPSRG